jgi:AAA15 family ATPase/GTPase
MKFSFSKIGFVDSGEVDIANLTIICGRNNTGKTYISHSIYGLLKKCYTIRCPIVNDAALDTLMKEGEATVEIEDIQQILQKISKEYSTEGLEDTFNADHDTFINSNVSLFLQSPYKEKLEKFHGEMLIKLGEDSDSELRIVKKSDETTIHLNLINPTVSRGFIKYALEREVSRFILKPFIPNAFVITSERTGAAMFYKDLDSQAHSILDHIVELRDNNKLDPFKLLEKMRSRYSLPIRNNIDTMRYAQDATKNKSDFLQKKSDNEHLFKKLKSVVGGVYQTMTNGVFYLPTKQRNRAKVRLPIHLSSSATKSLYLLDLYIHHIAKKGDVLIIDEPELNLHPDAQRLLAQLIIRLANSNIKIIITTHSDHLLRELNVLIMLSNPDIDSEDKAELMQKYDISDLDLISPVDVNAYVISSTSHNVHKMNVDQHGIHMDLFNNEINEASNLTKEAYYLIP